MYICFQLQELIPYTEHGTAKKMEEISSRSARLLIGTDNIAQSIENFVNEYLDNREILAKILPTHQVRTLIWFSSLKITKMFAFVI